MNEHDLWVNNQGRLRSYPDAAPHDAQLSLRLVAGQTPMALTTNVDDRDRLVTLFNHPQVLIEPEARMLIRDALNQSRTIAPPILPPTDYEKMAYVDELKKLTARVDVDEDGLKLTKGKEYEFRCSSIKYQLPFERKKMHYKEDTNESYALTHDMVLIGKDSAFTFMDDEGRARRLRDHAVQESDFDVCESRMWELFELPHIPTIAEQQPDKYQSNLDSLDMHEYIADFSFYPGQKEYIASAGCSDSVLACAETGAGKTVCAIALITLKCATRTLVVAPKGTVKDADGYETTYDPAQWVREFKQFAPEIPIYTLFSRAEYKRILTQHRGVLPAGVYVTYDHAMFRTGAFEQIPTAWGRADVEKKFRARFSKELEPLGYTEAELDDDRHGSDNVVERVSQGIGAQSHGIKCIWHPSLATEIGEVWDMVIIDEAHLICNLKSQVTSNIIRMQPRFKVALTATPIPNMIWNIFSLMGWLCVPNWYKGGESNPRWPYTINELGSFKRAFVSKERDLTQELINRRSNRGPGTMKDSPQISEVPRLLKLLRPTVAFISKKACNPDLVPCEVIDLRVPMGMEQRTLYTHYLDVGNIPHTNPRLRYGVQLSYLRGICADPEGVDYNFGVVNSNFNPKTVAILETIHACLEKGDQVVHVSARIGMTDELTSRLEECGIPYSRIDTRVKDHAVEAAKFKRGETRVMFMGINCAQGYSFENCPNLIVGSLEWSFGKFSQAKGRVWRLNSKHPVKIYVILHEDSIEEMMFDKLGSKEDAATICLRGKRVPREVKVVSPQEILAEHVLDWENVKTKDEPCEMVTEESWGELKARFMMSQLTTKSLNI